jgi:phosphoribosyl-ATP pyrophosphohydrolase/phosphoribosyl-AMP cyclohydrolase
MVHWRQAFSTVPKSISVTSRAGFSTSRSTYDHQETDVDLTFLTRLETIIDSRANDLSQDSYTASLIAAGPKRIAQKVGEESVELALAAVEGDREEVQNEAADLVYHLLVLLRSQDMSLSDVVSTLEMRHTG